ncbi:MAG: glycosyltransferase family 4 protein [Chloroflexi bacterium]|nr:glycosyltransferase family 4 protein [Chloroflexota bacterium]
MSAPIQLNTSPKALIVDLSKKYGGSTSRVLSLVANSPTGKIALAGLENSAVIKQAQKLGLPVHTLAREKFDPRILPRLVQLIRREKIQLIDSHNIQAKFWASLAAIFTNTTLISTIHSWYANEHGKNSVRGRVYTTLELMTNRGLDLYITVSRQDRKALLETGVPEEISTLIYNAVKIDPDKIPGDPDWLRKKFDLPSDAIVCVAVGRLVPVKGHDILIKAVQEIANEFPRLHVLIVGEGKFKHALQNQIENAGLGSCIHLVGYQDRESVMSIVKSSDIFAMPSRYEGTPIALLEAAALGRPIICTTSGGIPELVTDGEQALLVPINDPKALANGLARLCKDPAFSKELGRSARERVRLCFNLDLQINTTWDAYRKAWGNHQARNNHA